MAWSVCVAERPLPIGEIDNLVLGRDASHSFLRFKDDEGETFCEVHGHALNTFKDKHPVISTLRTAFSFAAYNLGLKSGFGPRLSVKGITDEAEMERLGGGRPLTERTLLEGTAEDIMRYLDTALRAGACINKAAQGYFAFNLKGSGQNCHTVTAELIDCMLGKDISQQDMAFVAPGITTDLRARIPSLNEVQPDRTASAKTVFESVRGHLSDLRGKMDTKLATLLGSDSIQHRSLNPGWF